MDYSKLVDGLYGRVCDIRLSAKRVLVNGSFASRMEFLRCYVRTRRTYDKAIRLLDKSCRKLGRDISSIDDFEPFNEIVPLA